MKALLTDVLRVQLNYPQLEIYMCVFVCVCVCIYIRTLVSRNSVSNKLPLISILQMSDVLSEAKCSLCVVAAFSVQSVRSVEDV